MCTVSLGDSSTEKNYDSGVNETTAKKKKNVPEVFLPPQKLVNVSFH